jgi:hypothetical protein
MMAESTDPRRVQMKTSAYVVIVLGLLVTGTTKASEAGYGQTAFSVVDGSTAQQVFKPDTAKIVLHVELVGVSEGETLGATWIAEKTSVAPLNYKIDSIEAPAEDSKEFSFSLSKPDSGWPIGDYRVDLTIDGKFTKSAHFAVVQ